MEQTTFTYEAREQMLVIHLPKELDHHNCRNLKRDTDLLLAENYINKGMKKMEDKKMETNREHMRLEMESLSRNEEFARVVTAVFMSRLDPTLEEVDDVKTAVSEAVTNAVIHGYRGDRGTIYLDLTADMEERTLTVAVKDCGVGIADVKQAMEPMFTTDPEGERSGMGFSFMEAFMDQVEVESEPNHGTLVTMKKSIGR